MEDYVKWIQVGDSWVITYILLCESMVTPVLHITTPLLFSLAHALELYLKGSMQFTENDPIQEGHGLFSMWKTLKSDDCFIPGIEIKEEYYDNFSLEDYEEFQRKYADSEEVIGLIPLLLLMKYTADLKYMGSIMKKVSGEYAVSYTTYEPVMADIFSSVRRYVDFPATHNDSLSDFLSFPSLSQSGKEFIIRILRSTK